MRPSKSRSCASKTPDLRSGFEIGIPGLSVLVLMGTTAEDLGLLPIDSTTRNVWEIDRAEPHLTAGAAIAGLHYSDRDKTL